MKVYDNEWVIEFNFHESINIFPFPEDDVRKWIFLCIEQENQMCGYLNFIFCSDDYLHKMNIKYLNHDTYTDIITFDYYEEYNTISGDLFISIDRVRENAGFNDVSFNYELSRVLIHGVLHLLGYQDKSPDDIDKMRYKENFYLNMANFAHSD